MKSFMNLVKMYSRTSVCVFIFLCASQVFDLGFSFDAIEQVHIALGDNGRDIVVTWNTKNNINHETPVVNYGTDTLVETVNGTTKKFIDGGDDQRVQYIHNAILTNLKPNTTYFYNCGTKSINSSTFQFKTFPEGSNWVPHLAIYGDLGITGDETIELLKNETLLGFYDAILHVGDIAYDLERDNGDLGDQFMKKIEPIAANTPYMVSPGNHENAYNFSHYQERYTMPGDTKNLFYSYNIGPVHIISFSTEMYYFEDSGSIERQYDWIISDLKKATEPENRKQQPWIMTLGHRPMYCTSDDDDDCRNVDDYIRRGWDGDFALEDLFYNYGVDIEIWGHEHTYEREYPLYNYTVYKGSEDEPYVNPKAPVHLLTGAPGCEEGHDQFIIPKPKWVAVRNRKNSYTRFKAYNATHVHFEQVSSNNYQVFDEFWIVKDNHGPYKL